MTTALLLDYRGQDPQEYIDNLLEPIIAPLKGFEQLRIFIHASASFAKQREQATCWSSCVERWYESIACRPFAYQLFYDIKGAPTGPCEDWFKNMSLAFEDPDIDRIVYLPYDIAYMAPSATAGVADTRLQCFIDTATKEDIDLLLGTYEASTDVREAIKKKVNNCFLIPLKKAGAGLRKDIPKNLLEDFTVLELWSAFPKSMAWFCQKRNDPQDKPKPRTGFFGLSKQLFEEFVNRPYRSTMLPWAGTVQLLLCAVIRSREGEKYYEGKKYYKVAEQFVADLEEPPMSFDDYRVAHQRERIAYVIADEHHYWRRQLPELPL